MRVAPLAFVGSLALQSAALAADPSPYGGLQAVPNLPLMLGMPFPKFEAEPSRPPVDIDPAFFNPAPIGAATSGESAETFVGTGDAVWYSLKGRTASGEQFDPAALTASHRSLPFGSHVRVSNSGTGRSVIVRINDRMGKAPRNRKVIIDLSPVAAKRLGITGRAKVDLVLINAAAHPIVASDADDDEAGIR